MRNSRVAVILSTLLLVGSAIAKENGQELLIPYWSASPGDETTLVLHNNVPDRALNVTIVLRGATGTQTASETLVVGARRTRRIALGLWLHNFPDAFGQALLRFDGLYPENLAALAEIQHNGRRSQVVNAIPISNKAGKQNEEFAVMWYRTDANAPLDIALANTKDTDITVAVDQVPLLVPAHGTVLSPITPGGEDHFGTLRFQTTGGIVPTLRTAPGATGKVLPIVPEYGGEAERVLRSGPIAIVPGKTLGVLLHNNSSHASSATVIFRASPSGASNVISMPQVIIDAGKDVFLNSRLRGSEGRWAAVDVNYTGQPGEVVGAVISDDTTSIYSSVLRSGASQDWVVVDTFGTSPIDAALRVVNVSDSTARYVFILTDAADGQVVYESSESAIGGFKDQIVDIGELRRLQVPDRRGRTLAQESEVAIQVSATDPAAQFLVASSATPNSESVVPEVLNLCCGHVNPIILPDPWSGPIGFRQAEIPYVRNTCTNNYIISHGDFWTVENPIIASVTTTGSVMGLAVGNSFVDSYVETWLGGLQCGEIYDQLARSGVDVVSFSVSCSAVERGQTTTCTLTATNLPTGATYNGANWKFTSGSTIVSRGTTQANTWQGVAVTSGTVTVDTLLNGVPVGTVSGSLTVNPRGTFAFTAVNPVQVMGTNTLTCYNGDNATLPSPPQPDAMEGFECADLAYSFNFNTVNDTGPNSGYEYVTSASDRNGANPTKFEFIVVSDLLTTTTFYTAQCGDYASSNLAGFIAGSQLKQNVFDHEQGPILSHWTEYRDSQNSSANNIGVVLESAVGQPGSTGGSFAQTPADAALNRIAQASRLEPCGGIVNKDSSQSCATCGAINFNPYQACQGQPVPHCQ